MRPRYETGYWIAQKMEHTASDHKDGQQQPNKEKKMKMHPPAAPSSQQTNQ
jgi:hypothetical protein